MSFKIEGLDQLVGSLLSTQRRVESNMLDSLGDSAEDLLGESIAVAPYEEGDLRDAGFIGRTGEGFIVGYQGLPYILVQHEGGWLNHMGRNGPVDIENYTTPGTSSKFLEGPFVAGLPRYKEAAREAVRRALKG